MCKAEDDFCTFSDFLGYLEYLFLNTNIMFYREKKSIKLYY